MNAPAAGQNLVIVGASGLVGGYALRYALDHPIMRSPNMGRLVDRPRPHESNLGGTQQLHPVSRVAFLDH